MYSSQKENQEEDNEDNLFNTLVLHVDKGQTPVRIDKFMMNHSNISSRNRIQQAAKVGNLLVNDAPVKVNYKVRPNDVITIIYPKAINKADLSPENIPLDIVYEDDVLLVINKAPGLVVHPGVGNWSGTLVNALLYHVNALPGEAEERAGLVHRIDKDTSGLLVVAKTDDAMSHLAKQFFNRTINRRYQAIVWGDFEEDTGTIEGNVGRDQRNPKINTVYPRADFGKHAVTHYKVLERFAYASLVECKLETGRTHQIRVHMKHIGHTLFNDEKYGGNRILKGTIYNKYKQFIDNCFDICPRQCLHAKSLGFIHPVSGEEMFFESDLPDDMAGVIEKWRIYSQNLFNKNID